MTLRCVECGRAYEPPALCFDCSNATRKRVNLAADELLERVWDWESGEAYYRLNRYKAALERIENPEVFDANWRAMRAEARNALTVGGYPSGSRRVSELPPPDTWRAPDGNH